MKLFTVFLLVIMTAQVCAAHTHPPINITEVASNITEVNIPDPEWFKDKSTPYKDNWGVSCEGLHLGWLRRSLSGDSKSRF